MLVSSGIDEFSFSKVFFSFYDYTLFFSCPFSFYRLFSTVNDNPCILNDSCVRVYVIPCACSFHFIISRIGFGGDFFAAGGRISFIFQERLNTEKEISRSEVYMQGKLNGEFLFEVQLITPDFREVRTTCNLNPKSSS